jgi:hypothetical protein
MHHLIFQPVENPEEMEMTYAQSGDWVKTLMDFDATDLNMTADQNPELFILKKVCALNKWRFSGDFPRFYIQSQVEVTLTSKNKAFCRVINARSHKTLDPLSLQDLQTQIALDLQIAQGWKTDVKAFLTSLFSLYQELRSAEAEPVSLSALYQELYHERPAYQREFFGLDLNRSLNSGRTKNKTHALTVLPAAQSKRQGQAFYVFDTTGTGQWVDQIAFVPLSENP